MNLHQWGSKVLSKVSGLKRACADCPVSTKASSSDSEYGYMWFFDRLNSSCCPNSKTLD